MQKDLEQIEQWLKKNAKKIYQHSLNQSASQERLNELEGLIGGNLPNDFKVLYQWHNGLNHDKNFGNLFYGYDFWDLNKVIENYKSNLDDKDYRSDVVSYLDDFDKEINPQGFIDNPKWIQFTHDGSRTGFYLDLNPSENGHYGQVIFIDFDYNIAFIVANSITDLVKQVSADMQAGYYQLSEDALEDGNHYLEVDGEIDILNHHNSERWKRQE